MSVSEVGKCTLGDQRVIKPASECEDFPRVASWSFEIDVAQDWLVLMQKSKSGA